MANNTFSGDEAEAEAILKQLQGAVGGKKVANPPPAPVPILPGEEDEDEEAEEDEE